MFENATVTLAVSALVAIALPIVLVLVLVVCLSCFKKKSAGGFSNFSNSADASSTSNAHVNNTFSLDLEDTNVDDGNSTAVRLEPLPDITAKLKLPSSPLRPRIGCVDKAKSDTSLKLTVSHQPFPRSQIVYLKELGSGWFGKVIESDAEKISTGVARSKVVVKMLKDDASKDEQQLFFEEVAAFRELEHPNMMRVLGQCTEINPMLMILEYAAFGNLKQYLRNHRHEQASLIQKNRLIQFALDTASGLACLHGHDYLHKDLAARNCLVMSDHTLKIGDYGIAEDLYKEDYMSAGNDLLPIRWMAPETLKQDKGKWTSAEFTKESDIWSLGVVLWEMAMLGERPYDMLTDEAVLQGVIVDKDIRLPEPDIGMPNKDRLYEIMRFCWMEPSERLKVDEVYKLLEQIASKTQENGMTSDSITAFEQKWEHLMPNQRRQSADSIDDQQGSVSSEDSNLLNNSFSDANSVEDLASADTQPAPPLAPPRASRRKLSVRGVTIPKVGDMSEDVPVSNKKRAKEQASVPQINIIDEAGLQAELPQQQEESGKSEESKQPSSFDAEFTEFTSHSTDDEMNEETPNASQIVPGTYPPEKTVPEKIDMDGRGDVFQVDALSKVKETLEDEAFSTPGRPLTQAKTRKTSTPVAKGETSPSSSSLSGGDSSATYVTAPSSSGNLTEAYATASDSTLLTGISKTDFTASSDFSAAGELGGDTSMSFEILDTTAVPSVVQDPSKSEDDSLNTKVSDPFSPATSFNKSPCTGDVSSTVKDDTFGEFTNGSLVDEDSAVSSKDSVVPSTSTTLTSSTDASTTQNEFLSSVDEPSEGVSKSPNTEAPPASGSTPLQDDPFVSFATDLSSLSSLTTPKATETADKVFPSFTSELSSLNSLESDSTPTHQVAPQSDDFAFDKSAQSQDSENDRERLAKEVSQENVSGLGGFSSDLISSLSVAAGSLPSKGTDGLSAKTDVGKESGIPPDSSTLNNPFTSDSGNQSGTEQSVPDLFGLGDLGPSSQDSFEVLPSQESTKAPMSSSAFSDFDILSSFSSAPAPSASPSSPFSGDGDLFDGFLSTPAPAPAQKESQDDVLAASSSTDPNKSSEATLLDFSAFESSSTAATKQEEGSTEKAASDTNAASSTLIDY